MQLEVKFKGTKSLDLSGQPDLAFVDINLVLGSNRCRNFFCSNRPKELAFFSRTGGDSDQLASQFGTGSFCGRSIPNTCSLTPKYNSLRVGLRHRRHNSGATFPRLLRECLANMMGQESTT